MSAVQELKLENLMQDFEPVVQEIRKQLKKNQVADSIVSETLLVFEALCHNIFDQRQEEQKPVTVTVRESLGQVYIRMEYEGDVYNYAKESSLENKILEAYDDNIDYSYHFGYNKITITTKRSGRKTWQIYFASLLLGIAVYILIDLKAGAGVKQVLLDSYIFPLETLFANAVLMVAAPVTFLTLLRNLTSAYIVADRNSSVRSLQKKIFAYSAFFIVLAIATIAVIMMIFGDPTDPFVDNDHMRIRISMAEFISTLLPSDIFAPFITPSPFPLIFLSIISTIVLCSIGTYFNEVQKIIKVCYAIFAKMLAIVMFTLPFFIANAIMDLLFRGGFQNLLYLFELFLLVVLSAIVPFLFYTARLIINRVPVRPFYKKLRPLLAENYRIGSAIDAVPYNIRYCARVFGIERNKLKDSIPVLAQINLNGNCFFILLVILIPIEVSGTELILLDILTIAFMLFFLSLGAPNQPGSFLIAMVIILSYMQAQELYPLAILCEAFLGSLLNITNVMGDIVMVACEHQHETDG